MKFYVVDCFAEAKYQGNQLAVFVSDRPISDEEMQQIANEMGVLRNHVHSFGETA